MLGKVNVFIFQNGYSSTKRVQKPAQGQGNSWATGIVAISNSDLAQV